MPVMLEKQKVIAATVGNILEMRAFNLAGKNLLRRWGTFWRIHIIRYGEGSGYMVCPADLSHGQKKAKSHNQWIGRKESLLVPAVDQGKVRFRRNTRTTSPPLENTSHSQAPVSGSFVVLLPKTDDARKTLLRAGAKWLVKYKNVHRRVNEHALRLESSKTKESITVLLNNDLLFEVVVPDFYQKGIPF